jgi:hypothetical protein
MELISEAAPFLVGLILPPAFMMGLRPQWLRTVRFTAIILCTLVLDWAHSHVSWLAN